MCNFFSCLVGKDKKVAWREDVDSHENLISIGYPGYKDDDHRILFGDTSMMPFARVEVTPINGDVFSPVKTWQFKIDQAITPQWWTIDHEKAAKEALKKCLSRVLIVGQEIDRLENRNGIFMKDSKIEVVVNCTVRAMRGSSTVSEMRGSSTVREMRGSSTVRAMWDSSTVRDMWDSSAVGEMRDSSTVGLYSDKATFAIADGSNGLAVVRHKKDVEIFHAHDVPTTLRKYIKVAGRFYL